MGQIKLGSKVRDIVSGFEGIAVSCTEWLNGCERYEVAPPVDKDGKTVDSGYYDVQQLKFVDQGIVDEMDAKVVYPDAPQVPTNTPLQRTGGGRSDPPSSSGLR